MEASRRQQLITVFGGILGIAVCIVLWAAFQPDTPFVASGFQLTVTDGTAKTRINYRLGVETTVSTAVLEFTKGGGGLESLGVHGQFHYLTEAAYGQMLAKYKNLKRCPASFLNRNARHLLVLSEDRSLLESLGSNAATEGTSIVLRGAFLEFEGGTMRGAPIRSFSGPARFFLLRSFSVQTKEYRGRSALPIADLEIRI